MEEVFVGTVSHYFAQPQVGAVELQTGLHVGDLLHFRGRTTDFEQTVSSMQIDHEPVGAPPRSLRWAESTRRIRPAGDVNAPSSAAPRLLFESAR